MTALSTTLTPDFLRGLREYWFEHLDEDAFVVPTRDQMQRWFMGGKDIDAACMERFHPALEVIRASGVKSFSDIEAAVQPRDNLDLLSLVLLLDQVPRNCYRGDSSSVVFREFDPLAQQLAVAAIERGVPGEAPEIRWAWCRRMWFYMPLMHAESLPLQERAVEEFTRMGRDWEALIDGTAVDAEGRGGDGGGGSGRAGEACVKAQRVAKERAEGARKLAAMQLEFQMKHRDIIARFGRFPHRNPAMGREPTAEEKEFLENGGDTFAAK